MTKLQFRTFWSKPAILSKIAENGENVKIAGLPPNVRNCNFVVNEPFCSKKFGHLKLPNSDPRGDFWASDHSEVEMK